MIFLSFGQEIFSTRPNLNWALSPSSIEQFDSNKIYKKGNKFKYNDNYYIMLRDNYTPESAEELIKSAVLINSIYDLNTDWKEPILDYSYPY